MTIVYFLYILGNLKSRKKTVRMFCMSETILALNEYRKSMEEVKVIKLYRDQEAVILASYVTPKSL